jgi:hypothetical protein
MTASEAAIIERRDPSDETGHFSWELRAALVTPLNHLSTPGFTQRLRFTKREGGLVGLELPPKAAPLSRSLAR